ncbi:MAG: hypothetical protein OEY67_06720 [Gammaproteobacteria bacterium]|nr:hypothetical protein [Gammaproteobacteria bacterium]
MNAASYLGIAVTLIGLIVLIVAAFRVHTSWGLLSVFTAPIGPVIFAITHWKVGRDALILFLLGVAVLAYGTATSEWWYERQHAKRAETSVQDGAVVTDSAEQQENPDQAITKPTSSTAEPPPDVPVTNPAQESPGETKPDPGLSTETATTNEATEEKPTLSDKAGAPEVTSPVVAKKVIPPINKAVSDPKETLVYTAIDVANAKDHIGKQFRVTDFTDKSHEAVLKELQGTLLIFEKLYASQGSVQFELESRNIKKLELVTWVKTPGSTK